MKSIYSLSALALIAFSGANAFATCSDAIIVDCAKFEINSKVCRDDGYRTPAKVTLSAIFKDGSPEQVFTKTVAEDQDTYTADINANEKLVVTVSSEPGRVPAIRNWIYRTHSVVNGVNTVVTQCKTGEPEIKGSAKTPEQKPVSGANK